MGPTLPVLTVSYTYIEDDSHSLATLALFLLNVNQEEELIYIAVTK